MIQALAPIQREQVIIRNGGDLDNTTDWVLDAWGVPEFWDVLGGDFERLNSANFPGYAAQIISTGGLAGLQSSHINIQEANQRVIFYTTKIRLVVTFKYRSINKPLTIRMGLFYAQGFILAGSQIKTVPETSSDTVVKAAIRFEIEVGSDIHYLPYIEIYHASGAAGNYLFEVDEVRLYQLSTKAQQTGGFEEET